MRRLKIPSRLQGTTIESGASIAHIQERREKGQCSYLELTKATLKRIRAVDKKLNAFITVTDELALRMASRADAIFAQDGIIHPLLGIPFSVKDVFCVKGVETTAGSNVLKRYIPPYTATAIQRLLDVGAVFIGKTNCDSFGHGSSTENSDFGVTKNPWGISKVAGGSSGGSGAAVATGMGFFSIAEDTGGSIRQPAAFCGISGLKPTYGRVSRYGSIAYASSLDTVGPMAKSVEDLRSIFSVISRQDTCDATTVEGGSPVKKVNPLNNRTIGLAEEFFAKETGEQGRTVLEAAEVFERIGYAIKRVHLPSTKYAIATYYILACAEASSNLARYDGIQYGYGRNMFRQETARRIMLGTYALSAGYYEEYYGLAQKVRTRIIREFREAFSLCDVLLAPVSPIPPFEIGAFAGDPLQMYLADAFTVPINVAGLPSLALPAGFSPDGLPIGMQLIGPQGADELLMDLGEQYQQRTDWHTRRPSWMANS